MSHVHTALAHSHEPLLVVLSIIIAMLASYTAIDLAGRVSLARRRWAWLAGGAMAMGAGIWSMHFTAMLAFSLPIPVSYDWPTTLASWLAAVLASAIALFLVSRPAMSWFHIVGGGVVMGIAISTMHYIGMAAMRLRADLSYDPLLFALSIAIAIAASMAALWLAFRFRKTTGRTDFWLRAASAMIMGFAISGMHYTAMAAAIFTLNDDIRPDFANAIVPTSLGAAAIAAGTFIVLAVTLLVSALDQRPGQLKYTLRAKFILLFLAVSAIPVGITAFLNYQLSRAALTDSINQSLLAAASQTANTLDAFVENNLSIVETEAQLSPLVRYLDLPEQTRRGSPAEVQAKDTLLSLNRRDIDNIASYALLDSNGNNVLDTSGSGRDVSEADRDYFRIPFETGRPYASAVQFGGENFSSLSVYFSAPVRDRTAQVIGVLRLRYAASILQQMVVRSNGLAGNQSFPILLDEHYIRLAHGTDAGLIGRSITPLDPALTAQLKKEYRLPNLDDSLLSTNLPEFRQGMDNADTQYLFTTPLIALGQEMAVVAVTEMKSQPWRVVFIMPEETLYTPVGTQARINVAASMGITLVVIIIALFVSQTMSRPIVRLTEAAEKVRSGNLSVEASVETNDEVGALAATFNSMTAQLRDTLSGLEQRVAERTRALAISAEVSRRLSTLLDRQQLVSQVVEQLQTAFNYYHAHIYLWDEKHENLVMVGGTGEAGRIMLGRGHQIPRGRGLVGRAAESNLTVLAPDVSKEAGWLPNPLLPETRAEVAVPISAGEEVLGVLDVQQNVAGGLGQDDAELIQIIASQVAIGLQNIRAYGEAQRQARREALVGVIGQKIQSAANVETALQVAVREVGQALGGARTAVKLKASSNGEP